MKIEKNTTPDKKSGQLSCLAFNVNFHQDFEPGDERERAEYIITIGRLRDRFLEYTKSLPFSS